VGTITLWSLLVQARAGLTAFRDPAGMIVATTHANGVVAILLIGLALWVAIEAGLVLTTRSGGAPLSARPSGR
jgi:hypothetical protein